MAFPGFLEELENVFETMIYKIRKQKDEQKLAQWYESSRKIHESP